MPALVKVLDGGSASAGTIASVWALMEICMKNPAGQQELLEHDGLAKVGPRDFLRPARIMQICWTGG